MAPPASPTTATVRSSVDPRSAADAGLPFTPAFLQHEWEQVILGQDLRTEQAYLTCLRTGRGRPLTKSQRSQVWQAAAAGHQGTGRRAAMSTHLQLANEATRLLRQAGSPPYRHVIVDEAQDLHPAQWRLLRAAVPPGPDDLFIAADPHQRIYDNRVSLASLGISVRGRSRRLTLNYRTTQEILAWAVPLLGPEPVAGLDGEADSLLGYRSPMHGQRPRSARPTPARKSWLFPAERIRSWLAAGIEPHAIGVAARSARLARQARDALKAAGIPTVSLGRPGRQEGGPGRHHARHEGPGVPGGRGDRRRDRIRSRPRPRSPRRTRTPWRMPRTCSGSAACCSSPAPGPATTCTCPTPVSRAVPAGEQTDQAGPVSR